MRERISDRIRQIDPSQTAMMAKAALRLKEQGRDIISLAVGEPGFPSPDVAKAAAKQAIDDNRTTYSPIAGISELKEAIIARYNRDYGLDYSLDEVCVTTGAKHSLYSILQCVLDPEDEVIVFSPYWTSYPDMIKLCGAKTVIVPGDAEHGFQPNGVKLRAAVNAKTRAVILNQPHNPTGMMYDESTLNVLAEIAREFKDLWLIADDIYDLLYWQQPPRCLIQNYPELSDRYIIANGVSKSYAMAGWRVGYVLGAADVIEAIVKFQSQTITAASTISQCAAVAALQLKREDIKNQLACYRQRTEFVYHRLKAISGIDCRLPEASFYLFCDIRALIDRCGFQSDLAFALTLLEENGVAVMPGMSFGMPGFMRLSCAFDIPILDEAIDRLALFVDRHVSQIPLQ
ncbi:MAG: pyridoxal phosphate-dependent aminotransferase [Francisellaceae bacterium]